MKKRMGAVLLSVLLALGMLPASIGAAEGGTGEGNLSQTRKEAPGTEEDGSETGLMLLGLSEEGESEVLMGNQMVGSAAELKALGPDHRRKCGFDRRHRYGRRGYDAHCQADRDLRRGGAYH